MYGLCIIYMWGGEGAERGEGGSKPYDGPYQLAVNRGGGGVTDKSCPGFPICAYVMYNTSAGSLSPISRSAGKPFSIQNGSS